MDFKQMWINLKIDMEIAVKDGFEHGLHSEPDTVDGGRFVAYRYVLDFMDEMDGGMNV